MEESEIIDKYLRGELDAEQMESFSKSLQSDITLQRKVSLRKLIIAGINQSYAEELKSKLVDFDRSLESKNRFQFSWRMAAVFVILIMAGSALYISTQKPKPLDFDIVEPGLPNAMGTGDNIELSNAMNIFKAGDYDAASLVFEKLLTNNPKNDTLLYFAGLCDFRNTEINTAIQKWNQVGSESVFFAKAEYRLAIAYWSIGDEKRAIELLRKIKSDDNASLQRDVERALNALD